ncbi:tripartite tricarboxylate transporter TctB family protein [Marivibrio halodurans]|uniref:Tripartite tricarboxylate transporter TctB family protein n=1 Tax=Marivibrio halodurans TaxID=2039722 RepID=A0A8J7V410_9PROT|nr:tripartite tricarboxylate transporter TctB family protein [Marivibrio halodurans]MBP5858597.1 tripartite tricarboxylate transporter TctB family protein [Marivibrio halodurans]
MKVNDAITGALFLLLAILAFVHAGSFAAMPGVPYGPSLFPRVVAGVMGLGGLLLMINGLRARRAAGGDPGNGSAGGLADGAAGRWVTLADWARRGRSYLLFLAIVGVMLFYILAADMLGFLPTVLAMLIALLSVTRGLGRSLSNVVIALLTAVGIYLLFGLALRVPLPVGPVEDMLRGIL